MAEQERVAKPRKTTAKKAEVETDAAPPKTEHKTPEALKAEMDELLDSIEEVLIENAAEFVNSYQQKGGE